MSLLEMKNIKKSFNGVEVLKDISLKVEKGEVLGIIGPSGSGKSTFFDVQRGLRLRMQGKSIIPEPLDWCFRTLICFRIIR